MTNAVRDHHPTVIDRFQGKELGLFVGLDEARAMLSAYRFEPEVTFGDDDCTVRLPELNLVAGGRDVETALSELAELVDDYVAAYLERFEVHRLMPTKAQLPWIMRLAISGSAERRAMVAGEPPA
jgi:hypothetical protein